MHVNTAAAALLASVAYASTLTPPVLPLIVRNPYLSTWLGNAREEPWQKWPTFWYGTEIGFGVLAHLPDTKEVFPLLGRPHDSLRSHKKDDVSRFKGISHPQYKGARYDASTTNLTYALPASDKLPDAADLNITLSFLSPITPTSTLRQSLPAAYLTVYVEGSFDVDIYIDINGQWVSGYQDSAIEWTLTQQKAAGAVEGLKTWAVKRREQKIFNEEKDQAEWGQLHFTAPDDVRHESGNSAELRQRFARTGTLKNDNDRRFRPIMEDEPVFAFSKSFQLSKSASSDSPGSDSVLFTISHVQDVVTQYASERGLTQMFPLWKSWFHNEEELISFHYLDFDNAKALAANYSEQLRIDAYASGSHNYVDIVTLSARQTMGATSFSGTPENPLLFLKEISSNGNCQTVDVIFPAFPFFLYTNPRWAAYLLEPLLEHQLKGLYPNKYSMHDLGSHFPNLTGHADGRDEYMPVEECGDMLIMGLALVNSMAYETKESAQSIWSTIGNKDEPVEEHSDRFTLTNLGTHGGVDYIDSSFGGGKKGMKQAKKWLARSYWLWKQWTGYLVEYSLEPHNQLCTDDFAGWLPLQTNLALKGIIGIKAFSELADLLGHTGDADKHREISEKYIKHWQQRGISRDGTHAKLAYDWYGSWTTLYSLYSDALLCFHPSITDPLSDTTDACDTHKHNAQEPLHSTLNSEHSTDFIPHAIYTNQSTWYSLSLQKYGLPLDSRHLYAKSDWEFYAAAVASKSLRTEILDRVALWLNETSTDRAFTDLYDTEGDGGFPGVNFYARPVVGGHFAFLALERACGGAGGREREGVE
ncbi:hypothetical protein N0V90_000347 [Kalmusia sp. IMI 367209]|nr:hypothetical protein N0V90_000347 [Kalmusia sp. IMI 367209]